MEAVPTGFYGWILQYGGILQLFVQMLYWIGMVALLAFAVTQYKRWVDHQLGAKEDSDLPSAGGTAPAQVGPPVKEPESSVSVEKFVE